MPPKNPGLFCPNPLRTNPGCMAFTVIGLPSTRRACSRVKRMFISLVRP